MVKPNLCPPAAFQPCDRNVELADVVRRFGPQYRSQYGSVMMPSQKRALSPSGSGTPQNPATTQAANASQGPAPVLPAGPSPAVIREQLQEARDRLVESSVHVNQALKSISDWDSEIPPLLKTSAGDKIAVHEDLVASLTEIVNEERTPKSTIQDYAKRIATLRTELGKRATSSTPQPLTDKELENIDELQTAVSTADDTWNNALTSARAIKVLAEARGEPEKSRTRPFVLSTAQLRV